MPQSEKDEPKSQIDNLTKEPQKVIHKKTGRPLKFKADMLKDIEKLASIFCAQDQHIAAFIGVPRETFSRWKARQDVGLDIRHAIEKGMSKSQASLHNSLFSQAIAGNMTALIFLLTNRYPEDWKDKRAVVNNTNVNQVKVESGEGKREFANEHDRAVAADMREWLRVNRNGYGHK